MKFLSLVVVCVTVACGDAVWVSEITSARGLDIGSGLLLKLNDNKERNVSIFDRLSLDLDYGALGVSARKAKSDAVELDFYVKNRNDGRSNRGKNKIFPMIIGYKVATIMTIIITGLKVLTMKALMLAKIALLVSMSMLLYKVLKHEKYYHHRPEIVEVEQHADYSDHFPVFAEYGHGGGGNGYHQQQDHGDAYAAGGQYYAYGNYAPSAAESANFAAIVDAGNVTNSASRRRDIVAQLRQRKLKLPSSVVTVRKYSTIDE